MMRTLVKTWYRDGFGLRMYDTGHASGMGRSTLSYRFADRGKVIFKGDDYGCSPCHAIDSLAAVYDLLSFLSLRPGDTDVEYFDDYTPTQMEWCQSGRAEELSWLVCERESRG